MEACPVWDLVVLRAPVSECLCLLLIKIVLRPREANRAPDGPQLPSLGSRTRDQAEEETAGIATANKPGIGITALLKLHPSQRQSFKTKMFLSAVLFRAPSGPPAASEAWSLDLPSGASA